MFEALFQLPQRVFNCAHGQRRATPHRPLTKVREPISVSTAWRIRGRTLCFTILLRNINGKPLQNNRKNVMERLNPSDTSESSFYLFPAVMIKLNPATSGFIFSDIITNKILNMTKVDKNLPDLTYVWPDRPSFVLWIVRYGGQPFLLLPSLRIENTPPDTRDEVAA